MFQKAWLKLRQELATYSKQDKFFVLFAMLCGFFITLDYAIIRPVSNSVFIDAYGAKCFPYAWLATVPLNFIIVGLYNRLLPRFGYWNFFLIILGVITSITLCCGLWLKTVSSLPFLYYVWKEIYVLLLFQQLWSLIHAKMATHQAKYLYGIFFLVGSFGAVVGSLIPGFFAVKMGSESLLFLCAIPYFGMGLCYYLAVRNSSVMPLPKDEKTSLLDGYRLIGNSKSLLFILAIVVCIHIGGSLVDYQFQDLLEKTIPEKDLRTEYTGRVLGIINFFAMLMQGFGSFLLLRWMGLRKSHLFVPVVLGATALSFYFFPFFNMISLCFISLKAMDFSFFGVIKEMLYIPLKVEEKFRAKAIIDVFAYRSSKAFSSCIILGAQFFLTSFLSLATVFLFIAWFLIVLKMFPATTRSVPTLSTIEEKF